jgi:UDP-2,3-diacylglucosamine hydrolase
VAEAGPLAIIAGSGPLPRLVAESCRRTGRPYRVVVFEETPLDWLEGHPVVRASFEKPGRMFAELRAAGCCDATFAGGMRRPRLNPLRFDATMMRLAPRLLAGLKGGDDAALRLIAEVFEDQGLAVHAAQDLAGDIVVPAGVHTRARPSEADRADAARAAAIVAAMGGADVGQGAVVAQGICLGLESIQGTDAMLAFVAETGAPFRPDPAGARGVIYKAPKPGQDLRLDFPAIGPATVAAAARAGLAGIAVRAGGVMALGLADTVAAADAAGLFVWGREDEP